MAFRDLTRSRNRALLKVLCRNFRGITSLSRHHTFLLVLHANQEVNDFVYTENKTDCGSWKTWSPKRFKLGGSTEITCSVPRFLKHGSRRIVSIWLPCRPGIVHVWNAQDVDTQKKKRQAKSKSVRKKQPVSFHPGMELSKWYRWTLSSMSNPHVWLLHIKDCYVNMSTDGCKMVAWRVRMSYLVLWLEKWGLVHSFQLHILTIAHISSLIIASHPEVLANTSTLVYRGLTWSLEDLGGGRIITHLSCSS